MPTRAAGARKFQEDEDPRRRADLHLVDSERRTVRITGQPMGITAQRAPHRRRSSPAQRQIASRPDRVALWAFLLGLFLVFMAAATAHAASL